MITSRAPSLWFSAGAVALVCWGCGGGSGGGGSTPPSGGTPAPPTSQNACGAALASETLDNAAVDLAQPFNATPEAAAKRENVRGRTKGDARDALWKHRARRGRELVEPRDASDPVTPAATVDVGEIAVIEDDGSIFLTANAFDLANTGLRFRRSGAGYEVTKIDAAFRSALGTRLTLGDDDTARVALPAALGVFGGTAVQISLDAAAERPKSLGDLRIGGGMAGRHPGCCPS